MTYPESTRDRDRTFTVRSEASANDGSWSETNDEDLSRLSYDDAVATAATVAARLSAHWGYVQGRRWGRYVWRVWDAGEGGVDCWVRIVPDDENPAMATP